MSGTQGSGLSGWQRDNIVAAVVFLRALMAKGADDSRTRGVYDGLMDILDPSRRAVRLQRDLATAAKAAAKAARERRMNKDRRASSDRRQRNVGRLEGERRGGRERRKGFDRRALKT